MFSPLSLPVRQLCFYNYEARGTNRDFLYRGVYDDLIYTFISRIGFPKSKLQWSFQKYLTFMKHLKISAYDNEKLGTLQNYYINSRSHSLHFHVHMKFLGNKISSYWWTTVIYACGNMIKLHLKTWISISILS